MTISSITSVRDMKSVCICFDNVLLTAAHKGALLSSRKQNVVRSARSMKEQAATASWQRSWLES